MTSSALAEPLIPPVELAAPARYGRRSPALDGLRGIAILLVMIGHFRSMHLFQFLYKAGFLFDSWGWSGVDLFFVLSGFLITGILYDAKGQDRYFLNFYMRRALRIFPPYYLLLAIVLLILPTVAPHFIDRSRLRNQFVQWPYWLYMSNYLFAYAVGFGGALGHTWTLAIEEQFYLVWPAFVFFLSRARLIQLCLAIIFVAPLLRLILMLQDEQQMYWLAEYASLARSDALATGALLAVLYRTPHIWPRIMRAAWIVIPGAAAGLWALVVFHLRWQDFGGEILESFRYTFIMFLYAGLLAVAVSFAPGSVGYVIFANGMLRFFGKYSYGMYLYHWPLLYFVRFELPRLGLIPHPISVSTSLQGDLIVVAGTIALSLLSWHLLEQPLLSLKQYFPVFDRKFPANHIT